MVSPEGAVYRWRGVEDLDFEHRGISMITSAVLKSRANYARYPDSHCTFPIDKRSMSASSMGCQPQWQHDRLQDVSMLIAWTFECTRTMTCRSGVWSRLHQS